MAATSAFAQSTVEIYGRAHVAYDAHYKTSGGLATPGGIAVAQGNTAAANYAADAPYELANRRRVADDGSRIGFRVTEDLGGGAYAKAVIETGINLDTNSGNGQSGAANSGTGFVGSRDAWVGLGNNMGDIRLGRQNNFWGNGAIEDVGANRIHFSINGMYTAPSSGWIAGPAARVDNTVKFVANKGLAGNFAGSEFWFAHPTAAEQAAPNTTVSTVTGNNGNTTGAILAKAMGYTFKYTTGPWAAQYDWAENKNISNGVNQTLGSMTAGTNLTSPAAINVYRLASSGAGSAVPVLDNTLTGQKLGLAYTYAQGSKAYYIRSTFKQTYLGSDGATPFFAMSATYNGGVLSATGGNRKQSSNLIGVQHRMGNWELHAAYAKQGNLTLADATLDESGSTAYTLGARYELTKRTALTVAMTEIKNGKNNNINNSGGGQGSTAAIGYGSKLSQMGASIQHNF